MVVATEDREWLVVDVAVEVVPLAILATEEMVEVITLALMTPQMDQAVAAAAAAAVVATTGNLLR